MQEADDTFDADFEIAECATELRMVRLRNAKRVAAQRKRACVREAEHQQADRRDSSELDVAAHELLALRHAPPEVESEGARLGRIVQQAVDGQLAGQRVIVLRRAVEFPAGVGEALDAYVRNRRQFSIQDNDARNQAYLEFGSVARNKQQLTEMLDWLTAVFKLVMPGRQPVGWTARWSEPGCATQHPHYDYPPQRVPEDWQERAFSMRLCTCDGGLLPVWEDERKLEEFELIRLNRGDMVLFRSDVLHTGAPYEHGHRYTLHVYLDSKLVVHRHDYVKRLELTDEQLAKVDEDVKAACARL